jgi:hypothetical protein
MKFLRSVAGDTRKDQIRKTKSMEELNIFNLNAKILQVQRMEYMQILKKILI